MKYTLSDEQILLATAAAEVLERMGLGLVFQGNEVSLCVGIGDTAEDPEDDEVGTRIALARVEFPE